MQSNKTQLNVKYFKVITDQSPDWEKRVFLF